METIYTYNPTQEELEAIHPDYSGMQEAGYLEELNERAEAARSTPEYEAVVDLQELFKMRGDRQKLNEYTDLIQTKFAMLTQKLFNE